MLQHRSILQVADNTGAHALMLIGVPGFGKKRFAKIGDRIRGVVKVGEPQSQVKKHEIVDAVIVRTKKEIKRFDGSYIRFSDNAAVLVDKSGNPIGTRIFGPVARELKDKGYAKIISLAPEVW